MRMVKPSTVTQHACTSAHKMGSKESRCAQNLIFILKKTPTMPVAAIAVVSKHKSEFAARNLVWLRVHLRKHGVDTNCGWKSSKRNPQTKKQINRFEKERNLSRLLDTPSWPMAVRNMTHRSIRSIHKSFSFVRWFARSFHILALSWRTVIVSRFKDVDDDTNHSTKLARAVCVSCIPDRTTLPRTKWLIKQTPFSSAHSMLSRNIIHSSAKCQNLTTQGPQPFYVYLRLAMCIDANLHSALYGPAASHALKRHSLFPLFSLCYRTEPPLPLSFTIENLSNAYNSRYWWSDDIAAIYTGRIKISNPRVENCD